MLIIFISSVPYSWFVVEVACKLPKEQKQHKNCHKKNYKDI